jgi:regulator of protease activity HflC (stomatin/prohibitin superfamily)
MPVDPAITAAAGALRTARTDQRPSRSPRLNIVAILIFLLFIVLAVVSSGIMRSEVPLVVLAIVGLVAAQSPRIAAEWERGVVLRLGRFQGLRGPGLFWIVPFFDSVNSWIDQRVITTGFAAEQSLTADTVPVNVDAVLFWLVHDPQKAALEVQDYFNAVTWAAQTALRDIIGRTTLADLLLGREKIEGELQQLIDERSNPWGVTVQAVEMRDVLIPESLQDAMSRQAQATREKQARVILGEAEVEIAALFSSAADAYRANPTALHLRAMNMLYEGLKEKGALMVVPSSAVETMGLGAFMGAAALSQQAQPGAPAAE